MSDMQIQQVLAQMRAMAVRAGGESATTAQAQGTDFAKVLQQSMQQVNQAQREAGDLATRFTAGEADVGLPEVMVSMQKASLQFEAVTQVRNRLVAAYQEIMNMSI